MFYFPDLLHTIRPDELHWPYEMKTNRDLLDFANGMLRPAPSTAVEIFMLCDVVQCLLTLGALLYTLAKKGRVRNLSIFSLRKSPYGTFIVPNAVVAMLSGMCIFLTTWAGFCAYIVWVQRSDHPLADWLWFIPYPW